MSKKSFFVWITLLVFVAIFFAAISQTPTNQSKNLPGAGITSLTVGTTIISLEIAATDTARTLGLSGRSGLPRDTGLLFVFDYPNYWGFWMKDMKFPIDIIWLDQNFFITHLEKSVSPETYPRVFVPELKSRYVLEVNAGFSEKFYLKVGDKLEFR